MKVLVLGANGRTGLALLRALSQCGGDHSVIGLVRDASRLPADAKELCSAIVEGDAESAETVQNALVHAPDVIVCAVGHAKVGVQQTVRADVTRAFLEGMRGANSTARFIVVSSIGAGDSMQQVGWIMRPFLNMFLRHALADHTEQEKLVLDQLPAERWLVVRATGLNDKPGRKNYELKTEGRLRSNGISRNDVAHFIVEQINGLGEESYFGKMVGITW